MSSYYGRRASYVASWAPQRLYPRTEPTPDHFNLPTSSSQSPPIPIAESSPSPPSNTTAPVPPPPLYFPGEAQLARVSTRRGINAASSKTAKLDWISYPIYVSGWKRVLGRPVGWYKCLIKKEKEELWDGFPVEFGGRRMPNLNGDEEEGAGDRLRRSLSCPDSGIGLTPRSTMEPQHPLEPLFRARVAIINATVVKYLVPTRMILAALEMVDVAFVILLIVALGVGKGKQVLFLEGVEITLVVLIIANGALVNSVRMKRWALAKELRTYSRDWSPLPITSSTNTALLNNAEILNNGEPDREALEERTRGKDQPTMRWSMRRTEGSWWLSYRPVVKIELVTPSAYSYNQLTQHMTNHPAAAITTNGGEEITEPEVPPYVA